MENLKSSVNIIHFKVFEHKFTRLVIGATNSGCCLIEFFERRYLNSIFKNIEEKFDKNIVYDNNYPIFVIIEQELTEYLEGKRKIFTFPLDIKGSDFELKVWNQLLAIPYGETVSYQDIALQLGDKNLSRKVGTANGKNNIAIVIPCHRVIGKDGKLVGYGGGMNKKKNLLQLENPNLHIENNKIVINSHKKSYLDTNNLIKILKD